MILEDKTLEQAVKTLQFMRMHKPHKYGGLWFMAIFNDEVHAYRSKATLVKNAIKANLTTFEWTIYGK